MSNIDLGFTPSKYQADLFEHVQNGEGHIFVDAVAGSGKSTTIVAAGKILNSMGVNSDDILFLAFNKSIVEELEKKVNGQFTCKTLNGLGHTVLSRKLKTKLTLDAKKYQTILNNIMEPVVESSQLYDSVYVMKDLLAKCMAELANPTFDEVFAVASHYGIELPDSLSDNDWVVQIIKEAMEEGQGLAKNNGIISFDDQIWLPALWQWKPPVYSWVLCDEAQDLSKAKLALALSAVSLNGRFVAVGDPNQSIYGFAGADANSVNNIIEKTNAKVLPLSVCYRCPKGVISLAKELVPHIEHRDNAPDGKVETILESQFLANPKPGSLILCRKTNPLISLAIKLIANRIGAKVKGREIGVQIKKTMQEVMGRRGYSMDEFSVKLASYVSRKKALIMSRPDYQSALDNFQDRIACLEVIVDAYDPATVREFNDQVDGLFSDDMSVITLSTVHKAKGLEHPDVYIYQYDLMPLRWKGQKAWEKQQERNIEYVALTRSMENLTFIDLDKKDI